MTVLADLLANSQPNHHVARDLGSRQDFCYAKGTERTDQVQSLAPYPTEVRGDSFSLVFTIDGERFETTNIPHDAKAEIVQGYVDTALPDQITVAGGNLCNTPLTFTYDGDRVRSQNHPPIVVNDHHIVGEMGELEIKSGHENRPAMAALVGLGVVVNCPAFGECPQCWEVRRRSEIANHPSVATLDFLTGLHFQQEGNQAGYESLREALNLGGVQ